MSENFPDVWFSPASAMLIGLAAFVGGYLIGDNFGQNEVRYRDHVQATKAGIFIDGWDRNKVYDLKLRAVDGGK